MKKITFKESNAAITYNNYGDININPKYVNKFGYIEISIDDNGEIILNPLDFIFDCKGEGTAIQITKSRG